MARAIGLVVLITALVLAAQRLLVPFDLQVAVYFDGDRVVPVTERCGRAAPILLSPEREMADLGRNFGQDCTRAARTRVLEATGVVLTGGVFSWLVLVRGLGAVTPMSEALRPLPTTTGRVEGRRRRPSPS